MINVFHFSMKELFETNSLTKKHTFWIYLAEAFSKCTLKQAKLMSCFVNDYWIPTNLFKTTSKLKNIIFNFYSNRPLQAVILLFPNCPLSKKKGMVWCPALYCCLFVCLSWFSINFAVKHKLCTYVLCIFHSIIIRTYINKHK